MKLDLEHKILGVAHLLRVDGVEEFFLVVLDLLVS